MGMMPFPGRLIGVDFGLKVVGLAICDPTGLLSRPLQLLRRRSKAEDFAVIGQLVAEHGAIGLVVGLPESPPEITVYTHADRVRLWASRLAVYLFNERYSSQEAEDILRDEGRDLPERIDAVAAAIILQGFLDARHEGLPWPEPVTPAKE